MEELARSKNTPATDASFDLLSRVAVDDDSDEGYPSGTVLIPSDAPEASPLIAKTIAEGRPMAVVFPDGSDVVSRPPDARGLVLLLVLGMAWLIKRSSRRRDRPTCVPPGWVTEFHEAPTREPALLP
jgi:hypothetical protein